MKAFRLAAGMVALLVGLILLRAQRPERFDAAAVRSEGKTIVANAASLLSSNLMHAITHGGITNAIGFCSIHALPLTESSARDRAVLLRRVSTRTRNAENAPDGIEQRIIEQYECELKHGSMPAPLVEVYQDEARYFEPIVLVNALCLSCHGDPTSQIRPQTLDLIQKFYPNDEATGFKLNELRGIWSVSFREGSLRPVGKELGPQNDTTTSFNENE